MQYVRAKQIDVFNAKYLARWSPVLLL